MLREIANIVKNSKVAQFIVVFIAGCIFAAVFYPTKQIKESLKKTYAQQIESLKQQDAKTLATEQESYVKLSNEYASYKTQTDDKINKLTSQVSDLKSHTKTSIFKIVHPDGTVEEHEVTETNTDQTEKVTQQLHQEWQEKTNKVVQVATQQYKQQIVTLQQQIVSLQKKNESKVSTIVESKSETINPKNFTLDVGTMTSFGSMDYYGHITYNFFGPFIIGAQANFGAYNAGGFGLGLKF